MKSSTMHTLHSARQKGFSLLEVLIAIVVMSLGMLGLASLQMMSLKHNRTAHVRSQATTAAYDILDRMRANRTAADAGNYYGVPPAGSLAEQDINAWNANLVTALGATAVGTVSQEPGSCATICQTRVQISWTEGGELRQANNTQSFFFVSAL
jgi:type IV pilus assembly protein PilV